VECGGSGFRFSGDLPLDFGETCWLTVTLPYRRSVFVVAGIVRWVRGEEYGVETLMVDHESREELTWHIVQNIQDRLSSYHAGDDHLLKRSCGRSINGQLPKLFFSVLLPVRAAWLAGLPLSPTRPVPVAMHSVQDSILSAQTVTGLKTHESTY
jgi:PilZ domain